MNLLYEKVRTFFGKPVAAWIVLALFPTIAIMLFFVRKILMMKRFVFGDDYQMLEWFHEGHIAFPLVEIAKRRIEDGRFYPLYYQNFNLVSLLNPRIPLNDFAERCFYMQAGMWCLTCIVFFVLMFIIARAGKEEIHPACCLFVPLSLLTMLFTQAFVSYFLTLVLAETLLCVLLPLFFLFYYLGYKKENTAYYFTAWIFASLSLYCKENVFSIFAAVCSIWFLFGWKDLTRKHKCFLFGLLASAGIFLLLYYFIVYHNTVNFYNEGRLWGKTMMSHLLEIFRFYPVWIFAFILGILRLIRVLFYRERQHLFMDAMLFAILGFFISYLLLKLTDWWYWGVGMTVLMPVFFYWLTAYGKAWSRILFFSVLLLCFAVDVQSTGRHAEQIILSQEQDRLFMEKIDGRRKAKRILFISSGKGYYSTLEKAYYTYLRTFLTKLGKPGKWNGNVFFANDFPKRLNTEELYVIWRWGPKVSEFCGRMRDNNFQSLAVCGFYEAFSCRGPLWKELSPAVFFAPANSPVCLFVSGWAGGEDWGRWTDGKQAEIAIAVPPALQGKKLKMTWNVLAFVHAKKTACRIIVSVGQKRLPEQKITDFSSRLALHIPSEYTDIPRLPITIQIADPVSPCDLGISGDMRKLGIGLKDIRMEPD